MRTTKDQGKTETMQEAKEKKNKSHTCKNDCSKNEHPHKKRTLGNKMMTNTNSLDDKVKRNFLEDKMSEMEQQRNHKIIR